MRETGGMARETRIEYEGACYHVINRGSHWGRVFEKDRTKEMFELCLGETAERMKWVMHGWVVMGNHYHLAVETPEGNLSKGMQWLQVTFAARYNAKRKDKGHVFQGRYKAIVVEPGKALGRVCHYIDLNPVRAGLVGVEQLQSYAYGSFRRLWMPKSRPKWLNVRAALAAAGGLADTPKGHASYRRYLKWLRDEVKAGREQDFLELSRGMAIGSEGFLKSARLQQADSAWRNLDAKGKRQKKELEWSRELQGILRCLPAKLKTDQRVSAGWKAAVACQMKARTDAANAWLAEVLDMGSATFVSKQAGLARRRLLGDAVEELLTKLKRKT